MKFEKGNLSITEVAAALKMDPQTVRLMIQGEIVPWGKCWKRPGSRRYSYIISPQKFYTETGMLIGGAADD